MQKITIQITPTECIDLLNMLNGVKIKLKGHKTAYNRTSALYNKIAKAQTIAIMQDAVLCGYCQSVMYESISDETRSNGGTLYICPICNAEKTI